MSPDRAAAGATYRVESGGRRIVRAWRVLPAERRLAAYASIGLFVTLFLPWYQETVIVPGGAKLPTAVSATVTGWGAFSFVEAAVLLVGLGVLTLLFQRAEGKAFHLPGGDGWIISAAGLWCCVLVIWRIFDKQGTSVRGPGATVSGVEWGIFAALIVATSLAYAGARIRAAHRPEPPLPGEARRSSRDRGAAGAGGRSPREPRDRGRPGAAEDRRVPPTGLRGRGTDDVDGQLVRGSGSSSGSPSRGGCIDSGGAPEATAEVR